MTEKKDEFLDTLRKAYPNVKVLSEEVSGDADIITILRYESAELRHLNEAAHAATKEVHSELKGVAMHNAKLSEELRSTKELWGIERRYREQLEKKLRWWQFGGIMGAGIAFGFLVPWAQLLEKLA